MEYRTMNRKELACELGISTSTLSRRMKKSLSLEFRKGISGHYLLFENEIEHIHKAITKMMKDEPGSK